MKADEVRSFIFERHRQEFEAQGLDPASLPDDLDLRTAGLIDSFGVLELIAEIEERFEISLDLEELDADAMTVIGPLSRYVESKAGAAQAGGAGA